MRLALVQSDLYWEDIPANLSQFEEKIWTIEKPVDVIVLPEMFTTGFSMNAKKLAEPMNFTTHKWMMQIASQMDSAVCGSFMVKIKDKYFNRLFWVFPDGTSFAYDKRHLFTFGSEDKTFESGTQKIVIDWRGWKFCPLICYDLRFPVWSRNSPTEAYDCLIYVANWPQRRISAWNALLKARAIENVCYSVGVNRIGTDGNGIYHNGDTSAYDFRGNLIEKSSDTGEIVYVELDKLSLSNFRSEFPVLNDADEFTLNILP